MTTTATTRITDTAPACPVAMHREAVPGMPGRRLRKAVSSLAADAWLDKGRTAAFCAIREFNLQPYGDEQNELIQEATTTYYESLTREGHDPKAAWNRAKYQVPEYYFTKLQGGRCEYVKETAITSFDAPTFDDDKGANLYDLIPTPQDDPLDDNEDQDLDGNPLPWLTDDQILDALVEGRRAAGTPEHMIRRWMDQIRRDVRIIRLFAAGYTEETIAEIVGIPLNTIRGRRAQIRRYLTELALSRNLDVPRSWDGWAARRAIDARCAYTSPRVASPPQGRRGP